MRLSEHRIRFTHHLAKLILYAHETLGLFVAIDETGRTEYQQAEYVRTGKSWTMNSDHLRKLAVDWVYYKLGWNGKPIPIWSPSSNPIIVELLQEWVRLDPEYNYAGWFEWRKDSPHLGRKRRPGQNIRSRSAIGLGPGRTA